MNENKAKKMHEQLKKQYAEEPFVKAMLDFCLYHEVIRQKAKLDSKEWETRKMKIHNAYWNGGAELKDNWLDASLWKLSEMLAASTPLIDLLSEKKQKQVLKDVEKWTSGAEMAFVSFGDLKAEEVTLGHIAGCLASD
jgi:hypothetical protein